MKHRRSVALAAAALVALFVGYASPAVAVEPQPTTGSISGTVTLRGAAGVEPVRANIEIWINTPQFGWTWTGSNHWTSTDGTFTIPDLNAREYRLKFSAQSLGAFEEFWSTGATNPDRVADATSINVGAGEAVTGIAVELEEKAYIQANLAVDMGDGQTPLTGGTVSLWKLDEAQGVYVPYEQVEGVNGVYYSPAVREGRYAVKFATGGYTGVGAEYYADARYFYDGQDITVGVGARVDLGQIVLHPRYFDVGRLSGDNRFATAVAVTNSVVPDGERAGVLYLANGLAFPDALTAGPAASSAGGVILPVLPSSLPPVIRDEIARLDPERVVIVGGAGVVSDAVVALVDSLVREGTPIDRFGGASRYDTGRLIVRDAFAESGSRFAIIAAGSNYPDALAAGPAASELGAPVVLVRGGGGLDAETRGLLRDLGVTDVYIAGGVGAVSSQMENDLIDEFGFEHSTRLAGGDRYQTAAVINAEIFGDSDYALVTSGAGFADGLSGGPLASMLGAPLFLSRSQCLPMPTLDGLLTKQVAGVILLGGRGVLGSGVEQLAVC